jgi:hypothetical protein
VSFLRALRGRENKNGEGLDREGVEREGLEREGFKGLFFISAYNPRNI